MDPLGARHLLGAWCRLVVDGLVQAGLRDVVSSPGSRSAPLVLAMAEHPSLRTIDVVDERSAAFVALGQARVTGRPTAVVCTSGTAAAHHYPAVIEASAAHVPLVSITADRPPELHGCGANQTIDQTHLFGVHARAFFDLGTPDTSEGALLGARRVAAQAVWTALGPVPGPVHVNARARKPLEPAGTGGDPEREELERRVQAILSAPATRHVSPRTGATEADVAEIARMCSGAERGLIVLGPANPCDAADGEDVLELSARTGFPLFAEAASQVRFGAPSRRGAVVADGLAALLSSGRARADLSPDFVLQIGAAPTTRVLDAFPSVRRAVIAPYSWEDPWSTAAVMLRADLCASVRVLASSLSTSSRRAWAEHVAGLNERVWAVVDRAIAEVPFSEAAVARATVRSLPAGATLLAGNSLAIRHLDTYVRHGSAAVRVLSQRGASGIDGLVSGACGAALASGGAPVAALLGDLTMLHDVGGLAAARHVRSPLALIVLNNDGGRIFEDLPVATTVPDPGVLDHFIAMHGLSFEGAARMFGTAYTSVSSAPAFEEQLRAALRRDQVTIIEVRVPPSGSRALARRIEEELS